MATRFYLPKTAVAPPISPAFDAGWDVTSAADRSLLRTVNDGADTVGGRVVAFPTTGASERLARQFLSEPLAAQTISGTVKGVMHAAESGGGVNGFAGLSVRVVSSDGLTVRGTLLAITDLGAGAIPEFVVGASTVARSVRFPPGWVDPGAVLPSLAVLSGDRLVVEFGVRASVATTGNAWLLFHSKGSPDLPETEGNLDEAGFDPWLEFSQTLTFAGAAPPTLQLAGSVDLLVDVAAGLSVRQALAGQVDVPVDVDGALTGYRLVGQVDADVDVSGSLQVRHLLAGQVDVEVDVDGDLTVVGSGGALAGSVEVSVEVAGSVRVRAALAGAVAATVEVAGTAGVRQALAGWTLDESQKLALLVDVEATLSLRTAVVAPPPAISQQPARRVSVIFPPPTLADVPPTPVGWRPTSTVDEVWGRVQLVIDGTDVTFLRGIPTLLGGWENVEPGGDAVCSIEFPQVSPFEALSDLPFVRPGALVQVVRVSEAGAAVYPALFTGLVASPEEDTSPGGASLTVQAMGILFQADLSLKPPAFSLDVRDIGHVIAETLNDYASRDYGLLAPVTTGILTRQRGAWTPRLSGYTQDLLSTASTAVGDQWTITNDELRPVLRLKDRTTVHATVVQGQPGLTVGLEQDVTGAPNVIFGEGTDSDSCRWRHTKYPNLRADDAPVFPLAAAAVFTAGSGTTGFAPFADELRQAGYTMASGDTYAVADRGNVRDAQLRAGITVDGIVGPQTWAAIFEVGSNGGDLTGAYFAPLAFDPRVEPRLFNAQGADIGANPVFEPDRLRVERFINYGEGVSRAEASASAQIDIDRAAQSGWSGTITLAADPQERSRFELRAGMNILVKSHRGVDRLFHIAKAAVGWQQGTLTLTVDTQAKDLLTIAAVRRRDKEAAQDPGRRSSPLRRESRQTQDRTSVFDCEAGAGIIPRHAIRAGLWTVLRIKGGQVGRIARTDYASDSPAAAFYVAVFGRLITSNGVRALAGDPSSSSSPWKSQSDALRDAGLLIAWGSSDQAMGFYPGSQSDGDPLTGRFADDAGWEYESAVPPWLWVAEFSATSTFVAGRLFAAVT